MKIQIALLKVLTMFIMSILFVILFSQTAFGYSVGPTSHFKNISLNPGETYTRTLEVTETEPTDFAISIIDFVYNQNNAKTLQKEGVYLATGLAQYATVSTNLVTAETDAPGAFDVTIKVPEDIPSGIYNSAIVVTKLSTESNSGQIGINFKYIVLITATIGDENLVDNIEIVSFDLDQNKIQTGQYEFVTELKNTGTSIILPTGKIGIYDLEGNKIENIVKIIDTIDDIEIVKGLKSDLIFNETVSSLLPEQTISIKNTWNNINITEGKYKAKLDFYFGKNSENLTSEIEFEIKKSASIDKFITKQFNFSVPTTFTGTIANNGSQNISVEPQILITNLFGRVIEILPTTEGAQMINAGKSLMFEEVDWNKSMSGIYNATLRVKDGNKILETSVLFVIIIWWQIILMILIFSAIILLTIKIIKKYKTLKKQLAEAKSHNVPND